MWSTIHGVEVEVLLWPELVARTGSRSSASRAVLAGRYRRVLHGAYVDAVHDDDAHVRSRCLQRVLPDDVALSGRAALWAVGVDVLPAHGILDVTVPRGRHLESQPGLRPWSALLPDDELVDLEGGLTAVSAARAVIDVARREPLVEAVAAADAVLRSGAATLEQLGDAVGRAAGLRGVLAARRVLSHVEPRSESQGESRLRMRLVLGGLPRPEAQVDYYDEDGEHLARADLVLRGAVLEYDGREQRLRKGVFTHDRRRQNVLVDRGVELRRYTGSDVTQASAAQLCASVRSAVSAAGRRPAPRVSRGPDTLRPPRLSPLPTRAQVNVRAASQEEAA